MLDMFFRAEIEPAGIAGGGRGAAVTVVNVSDRPQLYAPFLMCGPDGRLENALFQVLDAKARKLPYRGIRKKRGAPDFETFVPLNPGEAVAFTADLATGWDFGAGARPYLVRYSVFNPHPDPEVPLQHVQSAWMQVAG